MPICLTSRDLPPLNRAARMQRMNPEMARLGPPATSAIAPLLGQSGHLPAGSIRAALQVTP